MNATAELIKEHEAIRQMLTILTEACRQLEDGRQVPPHHLESMVDFLRTFADKCHHAKEERVLFPALEQVGVPRQGGPIGVMLAEHESGRKYIRGMVDALERYRRAEDAAIHDFISHARLYIHLLDQHIEKENQVLFPMADARLNREQHDRIANAFAHLEKEEIGEGTHERFHELLADLKALYPSPIDVALKD